MARKSRNLIATELIKSVRNRAMVPDDSDVYDDEAILDILNEEMDVGLLNTLMTLNEEHLVTYTDRPSQTAANPRRLVIPSRSVGSKLRDLQLISGDVVYEMARTTIDELPDYKNLYGNYDGNCLFYVEGDEIVILANATISGFVRMYYHLRPNMIVKEDTCAQITEINRTNGMIQFNTIPSNFTSLTQLDFIQNKTPNKILAFDISVTSVSISTRSIIVPVESIPKRLEVGDWVCFPETSPYPNVPTELHPVLAQRAAVYILEAVGDAENLNLARGKLKQMEMSVQKIIDDRVEGAPRKIKSRHGFLSGNNGLFRKRRGNF